VFATRARWRVGVLLVRERSSDIEGRASDVSLAITGLEGISNESQLAKRSGLSTRVEFEEVGDSDREEAEEEVAFNEVFESELDVGCEAVWEGGGAGVGGGGVGMVDVTEGLPWAARARTTAS